MDEWERRGIVPYVALGGFCVEVAILQTGYLGELERFNPVCIAMQDYLRCTTLALTCRVSVEVKDLEAESVPG